MKATLEEMEWLRRRAAQNGEKWETHDAEVVDEEGHYVGLMVTKAMATYVSRLHNFLLPITNLVVMLLAKLRDRKHIDEDELAPREGIE